MTTEDFFRATEIRAQRIYNTACEVETELGQTNAENVEDFQLCLIKMLAKLIIVVTEAKS